MRLWIDDERPAPEGWERACNVSEALEALTRGDVDEVSFDHDLGGDETSRQVILILCEQGWPWPPVCRVHTANPVGREWLEGMINRYGPGVTK